jgi:ferrous iron transport protein A
LFGFLIAIDSQLQMEVAWQAAGSQKNWEKGIQTTMTTMTTIPGSISLSAVEKGRWASIQQIRGGHNFLSRLASLGFTPGARLRIVQNYGRGPLIVSLRDTRVALGRGEASKIVVQVLESDGHDHE